jgi:hypothetical protein
LAGSTLTSSWDAFVKKMKDFAADPKWATFKDLLSEFLGLLGNIIGKMLEINKTILGPGTNPGADLVGQIVGQVTSRGLNLAAKRRRVFDAEEF